jgi:hypothetical protein
MAHHTYLFGGFAMSARVLEKYAAVYGPKDCKTTHIVPFTVTCMLTGDHYHPYHALHMKMRQHGGPIHIHVLSGSCCYVHRFMALYPEHRARVISHVYDSPCHIDGVVSTLSRMYGIPLSMGNAIASTIFADCYETSARWVECSPFGTLIPTGIVTSTNDAIAPIQSITAMLQNWKCVNIHRLVTDSQHLESLRDDPQRYTSFCLAIREQGDVANWKIDP